MPDELRSIRTYVCTVYYCFFYCLLRLIFQGSDDQNTEWMTASDMMDTSDGAPSTAMGTSGTLNLSLNIQQHGEDFRYFTVKF